ncbi:DUF3667 domain-containing protein [Flavobacterium sp.]|uniref:DUF3667 domain-containing protein n=1 Tax=Flavobacterium sp. TaxID=239 RepID=UPI00262CBF66|nr:DUF3667 domain-containing protein [Flavobacterium sp.]
MSHKSPLREDKTCLNCNHVVASRFCPNCGQENTDTRKTFYHLFVHFFEDLTHYENAFWKTIKNLLLKPASLSKEYLSGKRLSYLAPVRLYIFISFVTFFLIAVIPNNEDSFGKGFQDGLKKTESKSSKNSKVEIDTIYTEQQKIIDLEKKGIISKKDSDSIQKFIKDSKEKELLDDKSEFTILGKKYKSVEELDSIQKYSPESEKLGDFEYWFTRKAQLVQDKYTGKEIKEKFIESFVHNLPKALFIYMPLFAFVLWLFQNKKRWYYFDHGIFTLHYFSFLLLSLLILKIESFILGHLSEYLFFRVIDYIFKSVAVIYMFYYFFPAHHRFYSEKRIVSIIKGIVMFFINLFSVIFILMFLAIYTFINIH